MASVHTQNAPSANPAAARKDKRHRDCDPAITAPLRAETREAVYARAERQLRFGKGLVIAGFTLLLAGALAYCYFSIGVRPDPVAPLRNTHGVMSMAGQLAMAGGAVLWLLGSFLYSLGALDSDPDGPDLYF